MQKINLENSQLQKASFEVFARVNSVMKEASIKTEDVENVMDDLQDAVDQQNEISEALSRPLIHIDVEDELRPEAKEVIDYLKSKKLKIPIWIILKITKS